jgi:hypothetical protein
MLASKPCLLIIGGKLRFAKRQLNHIVRPAIAAVLITVLWLQLAMAASETLHKFFHADADQPGHECAVTLFAHGQVETASVNIPVIAPVTGVDLTPAALVSFYCPTHQTLPPGRGPPSLCRPS